MIKQFLNETLTPVLYRIETISHFYNTVSENKFYVSLATNVSSEERFQKHLYFLSLTRNRKNDFKLSGPQARMTIDGQKFNYKFKSTPVNY